MAASVSVVKDPDLRAMHDDEMTLAALAAALGRRRAIFFWVLAGSLAAVTMYCILATRRYQATGQIQIEKDSSGAFGLESSVLGDADSASDALDYNITLQTEANILNSDSLALRVIRDLRLETTADFYPPSGKNSGGTLFSRLQFWKKPVEPMSVPLELAPNRRYAVLRTFASHLKVEPVTGTRLINVSYTNPDPKLAPEVVNHLIGALADYTFQARFTATAQASTWLTAQLEDLRKQTENLQAKAITLQRDTGMFGDDESHNVVLTRLEGLNQALAAAESNRILKEAVYRTASSGNPELIAGLSGNLAAGAPIANGLALIQTLRSQEATVKAELDEDKVRYGAAYPRIAELQAELSGVEKSIQDEVLRIRERARADYEISVAAENSAQAAFQKQKKLVNDLNDKAIAYDLAKQEAISSRDVYEGLLAKLKQAGVLEGLRSTNITVVNPARVPPPNRPGSPNLPLYYAVAIALGIFLGTAAAVVQHITDRRIRSIEIAEKIVDAPLLGLVPVIESESRSGARGYTSGYVGSSFAESLRSLRTSLMLSRSSSPPQVVLVTSPGSGEGKSTLSLEMATVLAQQGALVLLVETDLRRPVLSQRIGIQNKVSISTALSDETCFPRPEALGSAPGLHVLCSGTVPPFPAELLGSPRMRALLFQWRREYDFIVLDGPPVLPVTDAIVVGRYCDAVLLVSRHGRTERKALKRSYDTLRRHLPEGAAVGAVLNAVPRRSTDFYEYYGHQSYSYGAAEMTNETLA